MPQLIKREFELNYVTSMKEFFWTDSQVALGYINKENKRFNAFVANKLQLICDNSNTNHWHYIDTTNNAAEDASKGLGVSNTKKVQRWYNDQDFFWQPEGSESLERDSCPSLDESDPDIKDEVQVNVKRTCSNPVLTWLEERTSSNWTRIKSVIGIILKYGQCWSESCHHPQMY